ncbi:hypothetical protein KSZ_44570 [Dictyobacter formicarum]|uniref:Uncharacterized protein n=1 Tax=Dictyobacter formicarum TaxID=2778368 RepID=A0ABQ3VLA9_9CHLR|nr:hypothetical protein KSZ_44570 [Dictyobacter formicarum]
MSDKKKTYYMAARFQKGHGPIIDWHILSLQQQNMNLKNLLGLDAYIAEVQTRSTLNMVLVIRHFRSLHSRH